MDGRTIREKRAARIANVHSCDDPQRGATADRGLGSTIEARTYTLYLKVAVAVLF
jgi:hypothetical protein